MLGTIGDIGPDELDDGVVTLTHALSDLAKGVAPQARDKPANEQEREDDTPPHEHCDCGWCLPSKMLPVREKDCPRDPGDLSDSMAVPDLVVVLGCAHCGRLHKLRHLPSPDVRQRH